MHEKKLEKDKHDMEIQMETTCKTVNVGVHITEGITLKEQSKVGDNVIEDLLKCCYPNCIFSNMPTSPRDACQGICGKKGKRKVASCMQCELA